MTHERREGVNYPSRWPLVHHSTCRPSDFHLIVLNRLRKDSQDPTDVHLRHVISPGALVHKTGCIAVQIITN